MISQKHLKMIKDCFTGASLNINKIRTDLKIKRGNNTLRDFILGASEDPGVMALEKMADYAHMDFIIVPIKRLERLDNISKAQEEEFIRTIDERYAEFCSNLSGLVKNSPKKIGIKKEPKFKRNIDLSNSNTVMQSLGSNDYNISAQNLDDIFNSDEPLEIITVGKDKF